MATYNINLNADGVLKVAFGDPAQNDVIVRDAFVQLAELTSTGQLSGGPLLRINGPASLPVAVVIAHAVSHLYEAVGVFDPKLAKYVIAVSHGTTYKVGDLVD